MFISGLLRLSTAKQMRSYFANVRHPNDGDFAGRNVSWGTVGLRPFVGRDGDTRNQKKKYGVPRTP
jgi:hypothetical protein